KRQRGAKQRQPSMAALLDERVENPPEQGLLSDWRHDNRSHAEAETLGQTDGRLEDLDRLLRLRLRSQRIEQLDRPLDQKGDDRQDQNPDQGGEENSSAQSRPPQS